MNDLLLNIRKIPDTWSKQTKRRCDIDYAD
jgi:hypothetical protein